MFHQSTENSYSSTHPMESSFLIKIQLCALLNFSLENLLGPIFGVFHVSVIVSITTPHRRTRTHSLEHSPGTAVVNETITSTFLKARPCSMQLLVLYQPSSITGSPSTMMWDTTKKKNSTINDRYIEIDVHLVQENRIIFSLRTACNS